MKRCSLWDLWVPAITVCVVLPGLAGMYWRYYVDPSLPHPAAMSMALDSARLEPGGQCEAPVVSQARTEARQTRAH